MVVAAHQKTLNSYHRLVSEHKEVLKLSSLLSSSINSTKRMVTTTMEQFYHHKYLWVEERSDVIGGRGTNCWRLSRADAEILQFI